MKFYSNKFLISFLILTVLFYNFSVKVVEAKGVLNVVTTIVAVVVLVVIAINCPPCVAPLASFGAFSIASGVFLGGLVLCQVGINTPQWYGCNKGGSSSSSGTPGSPTLTSQTATPIVQNSCTTGFILNYETIDALQYGIYRNGNLISQGFLGEERRSQCWGNLDENGQNTDSSCVAEEEPFYNEDGQPFYKYTYNEDGSVASKKGNVKYYKTEYFNYPSPHTSNFSYTDSGLAPNKDYKYDIILLDRNGTQYRYPEMTAYTECIKLDLKADGRDGPLNMNVAYNYTNLTWETMAATSCVASGDWSGNKGPASGKEELSRDKLPRGTSNPGKGKTYNYSMSCQYPKDKTLSDSVSVTIFKYPDCVFAADPAVIEILPATSTLSWDCRYIGGTDTEGSDSCSINQGIGSVNSIKGSVSVRPSQETTYTLTCSTIDKTSDYQASVNIGFRPRVREVIPRW